MRYSEIFTQETDGVSAFMCRCVRTGGDGDENKIASDWVLNHVKERLTATDATLLSSVVFSLSWDFDAHITSIDSDQWSMVSAELYNSDKPFIVRVQCDNVEDGIAAVWLAFADRDKPTW